MPSIRAGKRLVALVCSMAALGMALGQDYHHMVNYRGQSQADLTCMQASTSPAGEAIVYRNDPSTNCFGFPSLQFDTAPVEGGKPNGMTIDWSLMVDQLQMQDDDRIHFHLPGFTGGHNTFGIMGSSVDEGVKGQTYTPNFDSEKLSGDGTAATDERADFGALVGIWGISCGTEKNLYMDRAKVDNLRTAEWDPAREMLKFVLKARRYGPDTGRHDGYTGTRSAEYGNTASLTGTDNNWVDTTNQGKAVTFAEFNTDPTHDVATTFTAPAASTEAITINDQSLRGSQLQAMEYSIEGPRDSTLKEDPSRVGTDTYTATTLTKQDFFKNDGYIYAPGNRVCGIYVDPTKLYRGQVASGITNGIGPLPPYGGIGKNWYKLAYMRRFVSTQCTSGTTRADGKLSRPGMSPETCSLLTTSQDLSLFWQVPFDGDTERVVGYQFTTARQMLPVADDSKPAGYLQAPTFSFAQAKGTTTGKGIDNCITVSLIPSVTFVSGSSQTEITIEGLVNSGTSDSDNLPLYSDKACTSTYATLKGSDGAPVMNFQPVAGTTAHGSPDVTGTTALLHNYRPFGRAARAVGTGEAAVRARILHRPDVSSAITSLVNPAIDMNADGFGADGYFDDVDWHTRARSGTVSALTTGDPNQDTVTASTLQSAFTTAAMTSKGVSSKLVSTVGTLAVANGAGKFSKSDGKLTVSLAPGYFLQAGELLVFSFKVQNPASPQDELPLTVSASGTHCDGDDHFCDGVADKTLAISSVPIVSKGKLLQVEAPKFVTATIYQASSDPDDLTTIFVTLETNVALRKPDAASTSKITIAGLCGFETGTDVKLYQNQKAGGLPEDGEYPLEVVKTVNDLPGLTSEDSSIISSLATFTGSGIEITMGTTGFLAGSTYAFAFQLQTVKSANAACKPTISSNGGTETIVQQDMTATNVGYVQAPQFTTLKIGQVTTRPGVTNYLCVTLQHNYEFNSDSVVNQGLGATGNYVESKITISGLTGTQAVSTTGSQTNGYALAYCPTSVPYFDDKTTQHTSTQFQPDVTAFTPKRYATFQTSCFGSSASAQQCVPGNPYVPPSALDTSVAGRSWFGGQNLDKDSFSWDQATGTAILTVDSDITKERVTEPQTIKGGIPKNSEIVFALPLQNGVANSDCKTVTFESSGKIVQKATMVQTKTGIALQDGEMMGDACALKVYEPGFLTRQITQSTSSTGDDNVITVSLRTNVPLSSIVDGQASYVTISGLTGTATGSNDLGIIAPSMKFSPKFESGEGTWNQGTGTMTLKLDAGDGICRPPTVWASGDYYDGTSVKTAPFALGGSDAAGVIQTSTLKTTLKDDVVGYKTGGKIATSMPSVCIAPGYTYVFSWTITNPALEQSAPDVYIEGKYRNSDNVEVPIAKKLMQAPISDDADKTAMLVSNQILTTYEIGQLIPAPGSMNVICVTLVASKDIKSEANAPLSSITFTGLTDFDASAQDLQMYYNDGVTKITSVGGDPSTDPYKVGAIFSSQNSASGTTATQTNAGFATSGLGFANYDGKTTGNVVVWIQGETAQSGVYSYVQKNVEHKFCFRLKNPKSEMACKDVSVIVNNKGTISTVKAEQDMFNTIEDYKFGSTCAGYVAPPNFVVKNWRSSSNTTSATAVIHLELGANILLETGDTITVSGLTSYTKGCTSPPCDVGIDVTRTAVSHVHGKSYINGMRNVNGYGVSDQKASEASRIAFAKAIQSVDTSGSKDDGSMTSTFGTDASWGKLGDTEASASTLTFTIAKDAEMATSDIANEISATDPASTISMVSAPTEVPLYEIVFTLQNKATAVETAPTISINIGQGQTQYVSLPVNNGKAMAASNGIKVCEGGLEITYTPMKSIYGGESLILTLPKFARDTNGMLFGVTSSPNTAFTTYANWHDWKAYGTAQKYARAFFTNGFVADGYHAKSGDAGQTGERWNYPNVNAKVTTDADYNHDTGVLVLDINDPGVGMNKDYWYAATEDNLYEGRVTRAANDGSTNSHGYVAGAASLTSIAQPATASSTADSVAWGTPGTGATVDYYLDNGEDLMPVRAFTRIGEHDTTTTSDHNNMMRSVSYMELSSTTPQTLYLGSFKTVNTFPAPVPTTVTALGNDIVGTPPFKGIPSKYQPSRRDNFYKGMLMKCWVGTNPVGGRLPYVADQSAGVDNFKVETGNVQELLPPPERVPLSMTGKKLAAALTDLQDEASLGGAVAQNVIVADEVKNAKAFSKAGVSRALETRVIQASFRQIDYVPRKSGGCFVDGDVDVRAVMNGAAVSSRVAAAATAEAYFTSTLTYDTAATATVGIVGSFFVGQQVVLSDGIARTVTSITDTCAGVATALTICVRGDYVDATVGADNQPILGLAKATTIAAVGCQDEVPGYPAVVRLESPFSRPLDPDTLCYIQRKADVGVYTGMTAMVGNTEYLIKQGAANIYTVGHVATEMKDSNGNPVDRKVPRSYSTESGNLGTDGKRTAGGFFSDGVGLSGQPYTIYSQLELVAKQGSKVMSGETIIITVPSSASIMPPSDMSGLVTPANAEDLISDKVKISHVLLVPLSPACSIVGGYGVSSGCQDGNGKGGVFDLILSDKWPYAYTSENENDINGYAMTVFGGQATVIKTLADKYSQDLPYKPLEGLNGATFAADATTGLTPAFQSLNVINPFVDTRRDSGTYTYNEQPTAGVSIATAAPLGRAQSTTAKSTAVNTALTVSGTTNANSQIDATFTVAKELDTLTLTGGSLRANAQKTPKLPNSPIVLTDGACGTKISDTLGAATLPYAVCMSLDGSLAHNQDLEAIDMVANALSSITGSESGTLVGATDAVAMQWGLVSQVTITLAGAVANEVLANYVRPGDTVVFDADDAAKRVFAKVESIDNHDTRKLSVIRFWPPHDGATAAITPDAVNVYVMNTGPLVDDSGTLIEGVQKITGAVGQEATPVMPIKLADIYTGMGSARSVPNYGTVEGMSENPADNLGLGAYIVVGVYNNGTSDRFVHAQQNNKGTKKMAFPVKADLRSNLVIQRYIGTSRTTIPLADVPSGYIGGNAINKPSDGFPKPAGQVPRYQARVAGGYSIGRFSHGVDNIMNVRSDVTSNAYPTGFQGIAKAGYITGATNPDSTGLNVLPPTDVGRANMDSAFPMNPSASAQLPFSLTASTTYTNEQFESAIVATDANAALLGNELKTNIPIASLADSSIKPGEYIRFGLTTAPADDVMQVLEVPSATEIVVKRGLLSSVTPAAATPVAAAALMHKLDVQSRNKHLSGHSVDVTAPTTMQMIRFGRSSLPLPQVFHTAEHQASEITQANSLSRGHCGLQGAGAGLQPVVTVSDDNEEYCTHVGTGGTNGVTTTFNEDSPFSRNAYIEQGMDVFLVSSLFDTLIQRPEPIRLTATGRTEEGRTQSVPGSGYFVGDPVDGKVTMITADSTTITDANVAQAKRIAYDIAETPVAKAGALAMTVAPATSIFGTGLTQLTITAMDATMALAVGDIIYLATANAADSHVAEVVAANSEAMLVVAVVSTTEVWVERGVLGTTIQDLAATTVAFKRMSAGAFPGSPMAPVTSPAVLHRDAAGVHTAHNQVRGNIQTTGVRMTRGGPRTSSVDGATIGTSTAIYGATALGIANAKGAVLDNGVSSSNHNYGFDGDFRLYSVLGPFMRPAVIRDVVDTSNSAMSRSAKTSRFPGVLTIHGEGNYRSAIKTTDLVNTGVTAPVVATWGFDFETWTVAGNSALLWLEVGDLIMVRDTAVNAIGQSAEVMEVIKVTSATSISVKRGVLGTTSIATTAANIWKLPRREKPSNNAKYSLAPIVGTSFAAANERDTQYHTYAETDRIISFCNPLQGDLNNAPGSAIMSAISDDPVSDYDTTNDEDLTMNGWANVHGTKATDTIVNNQATRSTVADEMFASSNGQESTAPSMWTVPRRHHLCRKLVTGTPDLASNDVAIDPYVLANKNTATGAGVYSSMHARSRYTESVQMNQVLNQDPSPNMRAMVTFMEPTKIAVSTECLPGCEYEASSFDPSKVDPNCAVFTIKGATSSVTLPKGFPHSMTLEEIAWADYPEFSEQQMRRATVAESIVSGINSDDVKLGVNDYNKGMCLGNFIKIGGIPDTNTVGFTIKQTTVRDGTLSGIDTSSRRRLLATCPSGFDARLVRVGTSLSTACDCPSACGLAQSECSSTKGGTWNTVNLLERVCTATDDGWDYTGAIVGGVIGGFFGLLLIGLLIWYLCCRKPSLEPVGRAVAMDKPLAPVYLPQQQVQEAYVPFPVGDQPGFVPQPFPIGGGSPQFQVGGLQSAEMQPAIYSSYQGPVQPMAPMPFDSMQQPQPGFGVMPPFGVGPQPVGSYDPTGGMPYGVQPQYPVMQGSPVPQQAYPQVGPYGI